MRLRFPHQARAPAPRRALTGDALSLAVEGLGAPVLLRRSARAQRFTLRINEARRSAILTIPSHVSLEDAGAFLAEQFDWLSARLAALPAPVPFRDGAVVPLRGLEHAVRFVGRHTGQGAVWTEAGGMGEALRPLICVAGDARHGPRRLADWLKGEARRDLAAGVAWHAEALALAPKRIAVRDPSSRWGSCSSTGILSFSWRLILAPDVVLDYVTAHEVAHLQEMNHGPRFWRLVRRTMPRMDEARRWLRRHGAGLHRYGAEA